MCSAASTSLQTLSCCPNTVTSVCCHVSSASPRSLSPSSHLLLHNLHTLREPATYSEAASQLVCQEAMQKEFAALDANHTWDLVPLPSHKKPIGCKWVFKVKYKADGNVERCKARLVVRGFTQKEGIDFTETFSLVVKMTTIRSLLATAVKKGWPLHQLDVNNAFLHGDLHEEIYMVPPPGLSLPHPNMVCRLRKSLYGLKQASCQWYAKLSDTLNSIGFIHSKNDYSLFYKVQPMSIVILGVYVDDIVITGNDSSEISQLKHFLDQHFKIKDLGALNYFLGMEVLQVTDGIVLTQQKFAKELIAEYHCDTLPPATCPLPPHSTATATSTPLADATAYRKLVGKLNYLTNTRPDLSYSVQYLSQFLQAPTHSHMAAALHTLRYLHRDSSRGLFFNNTQTFQLEAFCDSDWAQCPCTRRSVSGYFILLGGSPISWKSKKQPTVALSSAEAKYRSMRAVTAELAWLTRLLSELQVPFILPIPLKSDSLAAIYIAKNPIFHERTKHIELDCHFAREKLHESLISLSHVCTTAQLADLFTKPLPGPQHHFLLNKLGVFPSPPSNLRGGVGATVS